MTENEFEVECAADIPMHRRWNERRWNGWRLDECELAYPAYRRGVYPIDLRQFTSSAKMLDMIMQVAGKDWATDECLAGLVRALNHILQPQAHLCSCGGDKRLTATQIKRIAQR